MAAGLPHIPLQDRLIVALDMPEREALALVDRLRGKVKIFKVGLQLLVSSGGLRMLDALRERGAQVFLDLKMLDIPETVTRALHEIQSNQPHVVFTTIHAFNRGLEQALQARDASQTLKVLVVTLLTSMNEDDLRDIGLEKDAQEFVMLQTARAARAGCAGVIASGLEAAMIRKAHPDLLIVTPGIRPAWAIVPGDDQKRIVTPRDAILNGADYMVVGRPVYANPPHGDPLQAVESITLEIAQALEERAKQPPQGGRELHSSAG